MTTISAKGSWFQSRRPGVWFHFLWSYWFAAGIRLRNSGGWPDKTLEPTRFDAATAVHVFLSRVAQLGSLARNFMPVERNIGRDPIAKELAEAKRIAALPKEVQRQHPSALP